MKCVHYKIINKEPNKTLTKKFGWFDSGSNAKEVLEKQYNPNQYKIIISKQ